MPAEEVVIVLRIEQIFGQIRLTSEQSERPGLYDCWPESRLRTDRAVASKRPLTQIDVRFKADRPTVTTAMVGLHHFQCLRDWSVVGWSGITLPSVAARLRTVKLQGRVRALELQ